MDLVERGAHGSNRHPWEVSRAKFFLSLVGRLSQSPSASVLDVGSGDAWLAGQLAAVQSEFSITCWDVNYVPEQIAELQHDYPRLSFTTSPNDQRFDGLLMLDVVEHVEDDVAFVRDAIERHLRPGGWLLFSVPAYQSLFVAHDRWLRHFRRYSPSQGRTLLASCGLDIVTDGGLFASLLPLRGLSALKERAMGASEDAAGVGSWNGGPLVTRVMTGALDVDARLSLYLGTHTHRSLPGLSYWAFCRPQGSGGGH